MIFLSAISLGFFFLSLDAYERKEEKYISTIDPDRLNTSHRCNYKEYALNWSIVLMIHINGNSHYTSALVGKNAVRIDHRLFSHLYTQQENSQELAAMDRIHDLRIA